MRIMRAMLAAAMAMAAMAMAMAATAMVAAVPASAATVTYQFSTFEPFAGGDLRFTFVSDGPVPLGTFIQASALQNATPAIARVRFTDACFIFVSGSSSTACDLLEVVANTGFGSTFAARYFADGAFGQAGPYTALTGSAATLTVSAAAVPEPAGWAMMIGGLGLIGGRLRRRRAVIAVG